MKITKLITIMLLLSVILASCEKEAGPAGSQGPAGAQGPAGTNGNANVIVYGFGETIFNAGNAYWLYYPLAGMTNGLVDSSLIMPYFQNTNIWYNAGELGLNSEYQSKFYIMDATPPLIYFRLTNPDGSEYTGVDITWDSVRVFVIPATIFRNQISGKVDVNDYQQMQQYYNTH